MRDLNLTLSEITIISIVFDIILSMLITSCVGGEGAAAIGDFFYIFYLLALSSLLSIPGAVTLSELIQMLSLLYKRDNMLSLKFKFNDILSIREQFKVALLTLLLIVFMFIGLWPIKDLIFEYSHNPVLWLVLTGIFGLYCLLFPFLGPHRRRGSLHSAELTLKIEISRDESIMMDGVITAGGKFKGSKLSTLPLEELRSRFLMLQAMLWELMEAEKWDDDALAWSRELRESKDLLKVYLDWREPEWMKDDDERQETGNSGSTMTTAQALEVLELSEGASKEEIQAAYRRMMQRVHPDREGGSTYFAKQLNEARDVLLGKGSP